MKLSPLTPVYRTVQRGSSIVILAFFAARSDASRMVGGPTVVIGVAVAGLLAVLAYELAYYRRFSYDLTADTFDIRSGVIGRRERGLPYGRIQNVDISRNVVQRVLGIAAVGFETAGGQRTEGSIRYVATAEAKRLQREIQRRKRGAGEAAGPETDEEELFAITSRELGLVGALSFDARVVGAITLVGPGSIPVIAGFVAEPGMVVTTIGGLVVVGLLLAAWGLGIAVAIINFHGFRLARAEDELRYERGLFRRYNGSIPLEKVQSVTIEDNPLKRTFDYATLTVETAGYAPGREGDRGSQVAVPIARLERVDALADEIEPTGQIEFERPPKRIRRRYVVRYLLAITALAAIGYAVDQAIPRPLPWFVVGVLVPAVPPAAHLKWVHRGFWVGPDHIVTRNGVWNRSTTIVPYYRIQTIIDTRTVFQRRWNVATVVVDTAGSHSLVGRGAAAVDIEDDDATVLRSALQERLQDSLTERREVARYPGSSAVGG